MVEVSNKHKSITVGVSSNNGNTIVTAKSDTSQYWANKSHTFADQAKESVQEAKNYAELANSYIEGFENVVTNNTNNIITTGNDYINQITETKNAGIEEITTAKDEAVNSVTTARSEAIDNITSTKTTILSDIEFVAEGEKQEIQDLADEIKDSGNTVNTAINAGVERLNSIDALKKSQITNCLLEVPQNIKLELKDGVLTLKAGSKVIMPNGFEENGTTPKFDYVKIESDISNASGPGSVSFLFYDVDNESIRYRAIGDCSSGTSDPATNSSAYYQTNQNIVNYYTKAGVKSKVSLPLAISGTNTNPTSIDQIFNGFGYIGSTIWVDKGVKGLIPNGRNEDGTLKNSEIATTTLRTATITADEAYNIYLSNGNFYVSKLTAYDEEKNINYGTVNKDFRFVANCGAVTMVKGAISSFRTKLPFRAVDWNDYNSRISAEKAYITQTYVNGTSWYRVYSDGWCEQGGITSAKSVTFLKPFANTNYSVTSTFSQGDVALSRTGNFFPVSKTATTMTRTYDSTVNWTACGYIA